MPTILRIDHIEEKVDTKGNVYFRTYVTLNDGDECQGWSKTRGHFRVGDTVERFFHKNIAKIQKRKPLDKA